MSDEGCSEQVARHEPVVEFAPAGSPSVGRVTLPSSVTGREAATIGSPVVGFPSHAFGRRQEPSAHPTRPKTELFRDILIAIHLIRRAGGRPALSKICHRASVSNKRLKDRLAELVALGLVDDTLLVTKRGFEYCADYKNQVEPFLNKYGLSGHRVDGTSYLHPQ